MVGSRGPSDERGGGGERGERGERENSKREDDPVAEAFDARETSRTRWIGLVRLSVARLWRRATKTTSGRIVATIAAVAMTVALLVLVTGIALALADGGTTSENDATAQIMPESTDLLASVNGVEGARLGETNERAATIRDEPGVDHASPVLIEPVRLEHDSGEDNPQTVLLVGVVPDDESRTVAGLSTGALESGDPHYADGSYTGPQRGEIVLSSAAADRLDATQDDDLAVSSSQFEAMGVESPAITVTAVEEPSGESDDEDTPVALVHLSELQTFAGASEGELADQVLVWGEDDAAAVAANTAYPDETVDSPDTTHPSLLFDDGLAFVTSALALLVGVTICAAFVATTAGMTVNEDRRMLAVLESVGFPTHSRLAVVAISTQVLTLCGAVLGGVLGIVAIHGVNSAAAAGGAPGAVAQAHPLFVPYAVIIAFVAGLIAIPYPLVVAARTSVLAEVSR
ncbi:hypothetical protein C483_19205 [Natrialba hulunbeirensis JCM 10989]|uniref:ABC3 transporter permease C-terminal domain-containing protein n=1 Tax=Natrialba hulunbeirensis JCM 10989 TaxID=1227493 RepID=L9ZJQ9_9EURY|nr:FtsX-like permease family protein [Natrialba hulunbeirensis]ELY86569.1 hypothetical protein C483_19205 [Natrialba hulunbeirensis JCM 10989]